MWPWIPARWSIYTVGSPGHSTPRLWYSKREEHVLRKAWISTLMTNGDLPRYLIGVKSSKKVELLYSKVLQHLEACFGSLWGETTGKWTVQQNIFGRRIQGPTEGGTDRKQCHCHYRTRLRIWKRSESRKAYQRSSNFSGFTLSLVQYFFISRSYMIAFLHLFFVSRTNDNITEKSCNWAHFSHENDFPWDAMIYLFIC